MRRKKPMVGTPIKVNEDVVSIVVSRDGFVQIDESSTQDDNYGKRLAARISRSIGRSEDNRLLEQDAYAPKALATPTAWTSYNRMLHSATPRFEQSRPREISVGGSIHCIAGRKEPKRGC